MDMVYIIIAVMLVCAAGCAIVLVWPTRPPGERQPGAAEGARDPARSADAAGADGCRAP